MTYGVLSTNDTVAPLAPPPQPQSKVDLVKGAEGTWTTPSDLTLPFGVSVAVRLSASCRGVQQVSISNTTVVVADPAFDWATGTRASATNALLSCH